MQHYGRKYFAPRLPLPRILRNGAKRVKIELSQNMTMLHIKLKRMTNAAICKHIFFPYIHPQPLQWGKRSNILLNDVMLHN